MLFRYKGCGICKPCAMYIGTWCILIHLPYLMWYMNVYSINNVYFLKKSSQDSTHFHLSNQQLSFDTKLFMIKINLISALPKKLFISSQKCCLFHQFCDKPMSTEWKTKAFPFVWCTRQPGGSLTDHRVIITKTRAAFTRS